jgi:hypothetical protein
MPALGVIGLAILFALALALVVPRVFAAAPPPPPPATASTPASDAPPLSREQLNAKLKKLSETPPPKELKRGAMCYDMAMPSDVADYTCPIDGSHTQYSKNAWLAQAVRHLSALRTAAASLPGLSASLDEREFCRKCTPKAPESPEPILVVKLADGTEKRTRGVSEQDLTMLSEFLRDQLKHEGDTGTETPLKDLLPRIRELLGMVEAPKPSK